MQIGFANDTLPSRIRLEAVGLVRSPRSLGLLSVVALLAGYLAPFGTHEALPPAVRYLYWALIVTGTACAAHMTAIAVEHLAERAGLPTLRCLALTVVLSAMPVCGVVAGVGLLFGLSSGLAGLAWLYVDCLIVVGGVTVLAFLTTDTAKDNGRAPFPTILQKVPGARRGRLIRLAARDHYVEVVTDRGTSLIAMRFSDAVQATAPEPGAQIHRSHWVALRAVSGRCRIGSRTGLSLTDGTIVPVGRSYRSALRKAGILQ